MPIRSTTSGQETIAIFESTAEEKYEDGFNLLSYVSPGNGIYLMGYAAEMLLKSAYFRIIGLSETTPITRQHLRDARSEAARLSVGASDEQFHNVEFWGEIVIKKRIQQARGLPFAFVVELENRTRRLALNWFVEMRYRDLQGVTKQDLEDVFDDVVWIKSNYERFWR